MHVSHVTHILEFRYIGVYLTAWIFEHVLGLDFLLI